MMRCTRECSSTSPSRSAGRGLLLSGRGEVSAKVRRTWRSVFTVGAHDRIPPAAAGM